MHNAAPEIDKDILFKVGNIQLAFGLQSYDRTLAISHQTSSGANTWTWIVTDMIPDASQTMTMKQWLDWLVKKLADFNTKLIKWLKDAGQTVPDQEVPKLVGEAALAWLIKNRVKVDAVGNITVDGSGIV